MVQSTGCYDLPSCDRSDGMQAAAHRNMNVQQITGGKKSVALVAKSAESAFWENGQGRGECGEYGV